MDTDSKNRILIFSQFNSMLNVIARVLDHQGIAHVTCKGNVHVRKRAISAFQGDQTGRKGKQVTPKVLLLSLGDAASGANLRAATHVILVDPLAGSREYAQAYEAQVCLPC